MSGVDDSSIAVEVARLRGYTTCVTRSGDGRTAVLNSGCDPQFPWWFRLLLRRGDGWDVLLPSDLRLAGPVVWSPDGSVLSVSAFRGIRRGVVLVEPDSGAWRWATPDDEASYVDVEPGLSGLHVDAVRVGLDGSRVQVRLDRDARANGRPGSALQNSADGDGNTTFRLLRWQVASGTLEGVLATPSGRPDTRWPLVVELHGGPVGAFQAGDLGHLAQWCARGFAAFMPEFRASGILGPEAMWQAFRGDGLPDNDAEAQDVISGVAAAADTGQMFVIGHSYGAYLLNRIVTMHQHPEVVRRPPVPGPTSGRRREVCAAH